MKLRIWKYKCWYYYDLTVFFSIFFLSSVRRLKEKIIINLKIDDDDDDVAEDNVKVMNEKKSVECRFLHIKTGKKCY